ncbi:hypothetical protein FRX31_025042 [Thalictrum thalictroides]|uniref:DUF4408 domain-containing protein n=1 Tax=Thalictrum thalictroides TaxID=46969 RepID=A0A7J6VMJ8_THATH|nr:hypothetical protein FRX31_025042 [Thalictrum thalictroides]
MKTYISSPKCLFILCNIIVVVLIGESKLVGGSKSSPTTDIYDEYMNRSIALRKVRNSSSTTIVKKKEKVVRMDTVDDNVKQSGYDEAVYEEVVEGDKGGVVVEEEASEKKLEIDEKLDLPAEELNKRVEDFIARVNKQRRLEALLCTSD